MDKHQKIGVSGFLLKNNDVLIVKRSDLEGFLPGHYELPGGKVEFGEKPVDAIVREFKEEVGLSVLAIKPLAIFSYVSDSGNRHTVDITFLLKSNDNNYSVVLSQAHSEYKWISKEEINEYFQRPDDMRNIILKGFSEV